MNLTGSDIVTYSGVSFDTVFRSKVTLRPVLDAAKRTVKWCEHRLEIEGYVAEEEPGAGTDASLTSKRQFLSRNGGNLRYSSKGYGDLDVNGPGGQPDLNFGPVVEVLSWRPAGHSKAAFITWACTTHLNENANPKTAGIAAFSYETDFTIGEDGLTEFTITGELEIAQGRQANDGRDLKKTADELLEKVEPPIPLGFRRTAFRRHLDKSKRLLTFTMTCKEMPAPFPPGVVSATLRHKVGSDLSKGFVQWTHSITGSFVLPPFKSKRTVLPKILLAVFSRLSLTGDKNKKGNLIVPLGQKRCTMLTGLEIEDDVYENKVSFSATARTMGASIKEILTQSGLFSPVPGTDFKEWRAALVGTGRPYSPRGVAEIVIEPGDDRIVDLQNQKAVLPDFTGNPGIRPGQLPGNEDPFGNMPEVEKENSWIFYEISAELKTKASLSLQKIAQPLADVAVVKPAAAIGGLVGLKEQVGGFLGGFLIGTTAGIDHVIATTAPPETRVIVTGRALRLQHDIEPPRVVKVGDIEVGTKEGQAQYERLHTSPLKRGALGGVPVNYLEWEYVLLLPRNPDPNKPTIDPANPALELEGEGVPK